MAKVFEFNSSRGSLKDQVSGTVPTNTNVVVKRTEKGRAGYFDGTAYLDYGSTVANQLGNGRTEISASVAFYSDNPSLDDGIFELGSFASAVGEFGAATSSGNLYYIFNGTTTSIGTISSKKYYLLTLVYNGSNLYVYLNNELKASPAKTDALDFSGLKLIIGTYYNTLSFKLNGIVSKTRIYNHALTTSEREALYQEFLNSQNIQSTALDNRLRYVGSFVEANHEYVNCGNGASLNFGTSDFSLFSKFKAKTSGAPSFQMFLGKGVGSAASNGYSYYIGSTGGLILALGANNNRITSLQSGTNFVDDKWHTSVATFDRDSYAYGYVDDMSSAEISLDISSKDGQSCDISQNLTLGTYGNGSVGGWWQGELAEIAIINRIVTQNEMELYRDKGILPVDVSGYWKINEGSGSAIYDYSENDNVGTVTNAITASFWQQSKELQANKPLISINNINWNADGVTKTDFIGDFKIDSGSFKVEEDATGKKITCVTNGTFKYQGLDLSEFVGNGYISELVGDLSGDAGGTVDDATNVSFANNELSIAMTAGQILRKIVVKRNG